MRKYATECMVRQQSNIRGTNEKGWRKCVRSYGWIDILFYSILLYYYTQIHKYPSVQYIIIKMIIIFISFCSSSLHNRLSTTEQQSGSHFHLVRWSFGFIKQLFSLVFSPLPAARWYRLWSGERIVVFMWATRLVHFAVNIRYKF